MSTEDEVEAVEDLLLVLINTANQTSSQKERLLMLFMKRTLRRKLVRWEKQYRTAAEETDDADKKAELTQKANEIDTALGSDDIMESLEDMVETGATRDPDVVIFAADEDEDWVDKIIKLFQWILDHQEEIQAFIKMLIELFVPPAPTE